MKHIFIVTAIMGLAISIGTGAYALRDYKHQNEPVSFYDGHTHDGDITIDAPGHSGGTDRFGCHNGSVPYHCH